MNTMEKYLVISGAVAIGVIGLLLLVTAARHGRHMGIGEKVGKNIDESLRDSKEAFDKATALVRRTLNHAK